MPSDAAVAAGGGRRLRIKEIPVRLIYNDPTRHFGGMLDDAECRLKHYLQVLKQETLRVAASARPTSWANARRS